MDLTLLNRDFQLWSEYDGEVDRNFDDDDDVDGRNNLISVQISDKAYSLHRPFGSQRLQCG